MDETLVSIGRQVPSEALAIDAIRPLIRIAHLRRGPLTVAPRTIADHELVLITRGACFLRDRSGRQRLGSHHLAFLEPGTAHAFEEAGDCEHLAVHFDFRPGGHQRRVRLGDGLAIPAISVLTPGERIEEGLLRLLRHWEEGHAVARLAAHAALMEVLARLLAPDSARRALNRTVEVQRMAKAERLLRSRFHEALSVRDLARSVGLSTSRFALLFRAWSGYAPIEYQRRLRIEEARRLLAEVSLSVAEVGRRCGFADPYHFSRVFRRIDGLPPTLYRENLLAGR